MDRRALRLDRAAEMTSSSSLNNTYSMILVLYHNEPEWRSVWVWKDNGWVRL
jgi:hypothetical protein